MSRCCTKGIDRMRLLRNLWYAACLSKGETAQRWSKRRALEDLQRNMYAERVCGVSLKLQLFAGTDVDPTNYNQMHGHGRFEQVVAFIRGYEKAQ